MKILKRLLLSFVVFTLIHYAGESLVYSPDKSNSVAAAAGTSGLQGEYYDNINFTGHKLTRTEANVNFNWGVGSPDASIEPDTFSVRWTGSILVKYSEAYTFQVIADDGVRLWVDGRLILDKWVPQASELTSLPITLRAGQNYNIRLEYFENGGGATAILQWSSASQVKQVVPQTQLTPPVKSSQVGLKGEYYDNINLTGLKLTRTDANVNFNWGLGSPGASIGPDTFSVRWTGSIQPKYSEAYTFQVIADDGVRLWVDGRLILDKWITQAGELTSQPITLTTRHNYDIRLEYFENSGGASAILQWSSASQVKQVVPQSQLHYLPEVQGVGLKGEYYDNLEMNGLKLTRTDATVNFNWIEGSPDSQIGPNTFSVRWTGTIKPRYSEPYTFYLNADDGVRLWIDGKLILNRWVNQSDQFRSSSIPLVAGNQYDIQIEYFENLGGAAIGLLWESPTQAKEFVPQSQLNPPIESSGVGLKGDYYGNINLTDLKLTRTDGVLSFGWGNESPDSSMAADKFSVRWQGLIRPSSSGTYTFYANSDDGVRLWVNGQLLIDKWIPQASELTSLPIYLLEGQNYEIRVEYFENDGGASFGLSWSSEHQMKEIVPQSQLYLPYPTYSPVEYLYDSNGRLNSMRLSDGSIFRYEYDANGNLIRIINGS
ncbi:PA14 domain-containing protein [Paenibacillus silagei]|uniref:YD repeat-containing protein n=1 Tax=Paenibacillus silagei TaxID=1670801 RepID=A0ABS4NY11_9BACL|nr:PA14 domain-containing protein [Paenibacillus silagei]MBP2114946.1 YD repeat-containing protein [Paenibacillus silagei]